MTTIGTLQPSAIEEDSDQARQQEMIFAVHDMHCAGCISAVENALSSLPQVLNARVNLSRKRVHVQTETAIDPEHLIRRIGEAGFSAAQLDPDAVNTVSADPTAHRLLLRIGVAGFGFSNVMIFSVAVWAGADGTMQELLQWLSAVIAIPVLSYAATPFFVNALGALGNWRLNMDVPISLAIILATIQSVLETYAGGTHAYFEAALGLTFFLLVGRYLDLRARSASRSAAEQLSVLEPDNVVAVRDGAETTVSHVSIRQGDRIAVRCGDRVPFDGLVQSGQCEVDNSFFSGESHPQLVGPGETVSAGQFVLTGRISFDVTTVGEDSSLRKLIRLIEIAESARNRYTGLADRAAAIYAPCIHILALVAFIGWFLNSGDLRLSMNIAVAVLIITCPCALGLAVPAVSIAATGKLFTKGLLIKEPDAIERLATVDTVILDKTGTVTTGRAVFVGPDLPDDLLAIAAGLAETSHHPYARAVSDAAAKRNIAAAEIADIREIPGSGIQGLLGSQPVRFGRADWVGTDGMGTYLRVGETVTVGLTFSDHVKDSAVTCIRRLQAMGMRVIMISGDARAHVGKIADGLGLSEWLGDVSPANKLRMIEEIGAHSRGTLMVGDGLNDAAAISMADISMAPSASVDITRNAAGIVILGDNLESIPDGIATARLAKRRIMENFAIAAGYNAIAVPVAVLGFATPLAAAIAMSTSSIVVSLNALRLR